MGRDGIRVLSPKISHRTRILPRFTESFWVSTEKLNPEYRSRPRFKILLEREVL